MSENGYGYAATPPLGVPYDAAANLKNMDMALRAEILSNARKQYEAAARELRLRAQAEAQAQQTQMRRQNHTRLPIYERPATSQERMLERLTARTYPGPYIRTASNRPSSSLRYSAPPLPSHPSSNLPSSSANTPTAMLNRFRQVPEKINSAISKDKGRVKEESSLVLEELKRRYDAQLANQERASYSRATDYHNNQGSHHSIDGSRSRTAVVGRPDSQYDPYSHASPTGHARTMADEYLDYYMPARRGPHSVPGHQRHRETSYRQVRRGASEQIHRRESPERICRQELERHTGTYELEPHPNHREEASPRTSHSAGNEQTPKPPPVRDQPAPEPQPSKGKLAFVLNPSEPGDSTSIHRPNRDERFDGRGYLGTGSHSSSPNAPELDTRGRVPSQNVEEDALHAHYSLPMKRKAPSPPNSPDVLNVGSEDETPRPKRRAFGRLPAEVDSQSELGPEEEEMDPAYVAEMSRSSKAPGAPERIRNAVEHPVTDRTDGLKLSRIQRNLPEYPEGDRRAISKRLEVTRKPENRGRKIDVDDEDNSDDAATSEMKASMGRVSRASFAENKKYHFRPRARPPHSR